MRGVTGISMEFCNSRICTSNFIRLIGKCVIHLHILANPYQESRIYMKLLGASPQLWLRTPMGLESSCGLSQVYQGQLSLLLLALPSYV